MLKKAGIVVAAAAAGLLAVSPLAFAGDHKGYDKGKDVASYQQNTEGLINVTDTNVNPAINVCDNQIPVNALGVQVPINDTSVLDDVTGALGLAVGSQGNEVEVERGDSTESDDCTATTSTDTVSAS